MSALPPPLPRDIRCPHCAIVILRKERIVRGADRDGAPEFCPRCGERTQAEASPQEMTNDQLKREFERALDKVHAGIVDPTDLALVDEVERRARNAK